jgi:membrane protein DedA with SNARE-associated domain
MELATLGLIGYGLLVLAIVADSVFPVVPSEAAILTAAAATTNGSMSLPAVIVTIAAAALAGDIVVHLLGRYAGQRWTHRLRRRRGWNAAADLVRARGTGGVLVGRFVPLGRTVVAFSTGAAGMPWRRYLPVAAIGAVAWAVAMTMLGRTASTVSTNPLVTLAVGMAVLTALGGLVTLAVRRRAPLRSVRSVRPAGDRQQVLAERRIGHQPLDGSAERDDDLVIAA